MTNDAHTPQTDCQHCTHIRAAAEIIAQVSLNQWPMADIAQLSAYFYARIRKHVVTDDSIREQEFVDWFHKICDVEFQRLNLIQPIEPKSFDKEFDFRQHIKGE